MASDNLGKQIDTLYKMREAYQEANRKAGALKALYDAAALDMIASLKRVGTTKGAGKLAQTSYHTLTIGVVDDFADVWKWAVKTKTPEIFQQRITQTVWHERAESGLIIPGTRRMEEDRLSLTKVK